MGKQLLVSILYDEDLRSNTLICKKINKDQQEEIKSTWS